MKKYLMLLVIVLMNHLVINGQIRENGDFDVVMCGFGSSIDEAIYDCKLKACTIIFYNPQGNAQYMKYIEKCDTIITDYIEQKYNKWFVVTRMTFNTSNVPYCQGKRRFIAEREVRRILKIAERACCERLTSRLGDMAKLPIKHELVNTVDNGHEFVFVKVMVTIPFLNRAHNLFETVIDNLKVPIDELQKVYDYDSHNFTFYSFGNRDEELEVNNIVIYSPAASKKVEVMRDGRDTYHSIYKYFCENLVINRWNFRIRVGDTQEVHRPSIGGCRGDSLNCSPMVVSFKGCDKTIIPATYTIPEQGDLAFIIPVQHEGELRLETDPTQIEKAIELWKKVVMN